MKNKTDLEHISIKRTLEIANTYMYEVKIIDLKNGKAFIELRNNIIKSPYPKYLYSVSKTKQYVQKMIRQYANTPF